MTRRFVAIDHPALGQLVVECARLLFLYSAHTFTRAPGEGLGSKERLRLRSALNPKDMHDLQVWYIEL